MLVYVHILSTIKQYLLLYRIQFEEHKPMRDNTALLKTRIRILLQRTHRTVQNNTKEIDNTTQMKH
jgi:hypothetical protein